MIRNGTVEAHGRTWPLYERKAFSVEVSGVIDVHDFENAELLQQELQGLLNSYDLVVKVSPTLVLEMSPEDRVEKEALDAASSHLR